MSFRRVRGESIDLDTAHQVHFGDVRSVKKKLAKGWNWRQWWLTVDSRCLWDPFVTDERWRAFVDGEMGEDGGI